MPNHVNPIDSENAKCVENFYETILASKDRIQACSPRSSSWFGRKIYLGYDKTTRTWRVYALPVIFARILRCLFYKDTVRSDITDALKPLRNHVWHNPALSDKEEKKYRAKQVEINDAFTNATQLPSILSSDPPTGIQNRIQEHLQKIFGIEKEKTSSPVLVEKKPVPASAPQKKPKKPPFQQATSSATPPSEEEEEVLKFKEVPPRRKPDDLSFLPPNLRGDSPFFENLSSSGKKSSSTVTPSSEQKDKPQTWDSLIEEIKKWKTPSRYKQLTEQLKKAGYKKESAKDQSLLAAIKQSLTAMPIKQKNDVFHEILDFQSSPIVQNSEELLKGIEDLLNSWRKNVTISVQSLTDNLNELEAVLKNHPPLSNEQLRTIVNHGHLYIEQLTGLTSDNLQTLREKFIVLASTALVPKISDDILGQARTKIDELKAQFQQLPTFVNCTTLNAFVQIEIEERKILGKLQSLKQELLVQLKKQGIILDENLEYLDTASNKKYHSQLTLLFSQEIGNALRKHNQMLIDTEIPKFLAANYEEKNYGGIGECLFRAFGKVGTPTESRKIRLQVVEYMRRNRVWFEDLVKDRLEDVNNRTDARAVAATKGKEDDSTFERYLVWMEKDSSYGGGPEVRALSEMHHIPLIITQKYGAETKTSIILPRHLSYSADHPGPELLINWGQGHFITMLPKPIKT